ncbi:Esterase lipase [Lasiodiplodia theobromae]|uniref:Esterase lipase n=1 Tax=Lasiodiplodia theobromae TaxID=45133 RepID=UPI0015C395FB|nr:Esterase lipase [Lasiodiplodia theobromae]KAF4544898.1 Esterase lipase [Lasiodiplodia theobromae]
MWRFFTYLRLKAIVTLLRLFVRLRGAPAISPSASVLHIPSRDPQRTIKAHVYRSSAHATDSSTPTPVLFNFHGSGFMLPLHGSDDYFCTLIAAKTPYTVLDIQYRLAPEHPFPAAVNDAEDALKYVLANPTLYDARRLAVSGFSAGANLAIVVAGALPASFPPGTSIGTCIAFYPGTDMTIDPGEKKAPDPTGKAIPPWFARLINECYIPPDVSASDPRISPCYADLANFAGMTFALLSAARDNLAPESEKFAARLEEVEGTTVVRKRFEGCIHGFDKHAEPGSGNEKARDEAYGIAADLLMGQ